MLDFLDGGITAPPPPPHGGKEERISTLLQTEYREALTTHQVQLQLISKALKDVEGTVDGPVNKKWAPKSSSAMSAASAAAKERKRLARQQKKQRSPPKVAFDANATLRLMVGNLQGASVRKAAMLDDLQQEAATSMQALAGLDEARGHLTRVLQGPDSLDERPPQTPEELEQELAWLRRKVNVARREAREEEHALRERAKQRGKELTPADLASDERLLAVRRKEGSLSRRLVALMRLKKPGTLLGAEAEAAAAAAAAPAPEAAAPAPAPAAPAPAAAAPAAAAPAAAPAGASFISSLSSAAAGAKATAAAQARRHNEDVEFLRGGTISMYHRAMLRYKAESSGDGELIAAASNTPSFGAATASTVNAEGSGKGGGSSSGAPSAARSPPRQRRGSLVRGLLSSSPSAASPATRQRKRKGGIFRRQSSGAAGDEDDETFHHGDHPSNGDHRDGDGDVDEAVDASALLVDGNNKSAEDLASIAWSVELRHIRMIIELRSVKEAVRAMRDLSRKAMRYAMSLPPPLPLLGVAMDAPTLSLMQQAFAAERAERIGELIEICKDDPRRRFVLGVERYEQEIASSAVAKLRELESAESAHEDGSAEAAFLQQEETARLTASALLDDIPLTAEGTTLADALVHHMQMLGYTPDQIGELLRAFVTHEPVYIQEAFTVYDVDGEGALKRAELVRALEALCEIFEADEHAQPRQTSAQKETHHKEDPHKNPQQQQQQQQQQRHLHHHDSRRFSRHLRKLSELDGGVAYNEFASLLQTIHISHLSTNGTPGQSFNHTSFKKSKSDVARDHRAERALLRKVPRRFRKPYETLRDSMLMAGYRQAEMLAVCRAMFVSQDEESLRAAWSVFDPMGRGFLSLREVQAAFSLFGDSVEVVDVAAEFKALDKDESGSLELAEFGNLLRRLSALARGAPAVSGEEKGGFFGIASLELELVGMLERETLLAIPLSHHAFARRLLSHLRGLGFAHDQVEVVLRAIFHPAADEADEATRQAWLLLGGTDVSVAVNVDKEVQAEVLANYESRKAEGKRWREQERARVAKLEADEDAAAERGLSEAQMAAAASTATVFAPGGKKASSWQTLRGRRAGGLAAAALQMAADEAAYRRRQQPPFLEYGKAPRKEGFTEWSTISLSEFERLVSLFGDWQSDIEMRRCESVLHELFKDLDGGPLPTEAVTTGGGGNGGGNGGGHGGSFKADREGSFKSTARSGSSPSESFSRISGSSFTQTGRPHPDDVEISLEAFADFLRRLRPLASGEREEDAELLALTKELGGTTTTHVRAAGRNQPRWMSSFATAAPLPPSSTALAEAGGSTPSKGGSIGGGGDGGARAVGSRHHHHGGGGGGLHLLGFGRINVLSMLEESTQHLVPFAHVNHIRLVLSNLRAAGFDAAESNVLIRALYSFGEPIEGPQYREDAWGLLREFKFHLHDAADMLASHVGEFRTKVHQYKLHDMASLRQRDAARFGASEADGLTEDDFQLVVSLLGEHLTEGQRAAIFGAVDFAEDGNMLPFSELERVFRFMYRRDERETSGSIKDNEMKVHMLEGELVAASANVLDQVQHTLGGAVLGVVSNVKARFFKPRSRGASVKKV